MEYWCAIPRRQNLLNTSNYNLTRESLSSILIGYVRKSTRREYYSTMKMEQNKLQTISSIKDALILRCLQDRNTCISQKNVWRAILNHFKKIIFRLLPHSLLTLTSVKYPFCKR